MHRALALAAAAAALSLPCLDATGQVILSGTVDVAVRQVRNAGLGSLTSEVSGSNATSKLVIRGNEDLGGGLAASFYLDGTLMGDSGAVNTPFWDRRATVSLADRRLGELRLGRDWSPTHLLWTAIDPFITLGIASANTFRSTFSSRALGQAFGATAEASQLNPTLRIANTAQYWLPGGLGGVYGQLIASAGEGGNAAAGSAKGDGLRFGWANKDVNIGFAQFTTRNANGNHAFQDQVWGASWDFGVARASIGQRRWTYRTDRTTNTLLGLAIPTGVAGTLKFSVMRADQSGATAALSANDATLLGAGYVYNLSKITAVYAHFARISNHAGAAFAIPGGPATSGVSTAANYFGGRTSRGFEAGIRHDF